jgi:predicted Zn-dependent protease
LERPKAPAFSTVTLVPLGGRAAAELDGLPAKLKQQFPWLEFQMAPTEAMTAGVKTQDGSQVLDSLLFAKMKARPSGTIFVMTDDLTTEGLNFLFGTIDFDTGHAAISVSRLRTETGEPFVSEEKQLAPEALAHSQQRLVGQALSTMGKMIGLDFPCQEPTPCVMRRPNDLEELDAKGLLFCPKHLEQIKAIQAQSRAGRSSEQGHDAG